MSNTSPLPKPSYWLAIKIMFWGLMLLLFVHAVSGLIVMAGGFVLGAVLWLRDIVDILRGE